MQFTEFHLLNSEKKPYDPGPGEDESTCMVTLGFLSNTNDFYVLFLDRICFPFAGSSVWYVKGPKLG